jgi:hypothetical protein
MKENKKKYVKPRLRKLDMLEVNAATCCRTNMSIPNCSKTTKTGNKSNKYNRLS